jgi:hypothetical protein
MISLKIILLTLGAIVVYGFAPAQTIEEIVAKNIEALGGSKKLSSIRTMQMEGTMQIMGSEVKIKVTKSHLIGVRLDIQMGGKQGYQINTASKGWDYMPFNGQTVPEAWPEERVKNAIGNLDIQGIFFNYKSRGLQLELIGKENIDTILCYKIKAISPAGAISTYYVDTHTNFIIKTSTIKGFQGEESEVASFFSNFKKTADGFIFPFTTLTPTGEINYQLIQVNIPIDEKIFSPN